MSGGNRWLKGKPQIKTHIRILFVVAGILLILAAMAVILTVQWLGFLLLAVGVFVAWIGIGGRGGKEHAIMRNRPWHMEDRVEVRQNMPDNPWDAVSRRREGDGRSKGE